MLIAACAIGVMMLGVCIGLFLHAAISPGPRPERSLFEGYSAFAATAASRHGSTTVDRDLARTLIDIYDRTTEFTTREQICADLDRAGIRPLATELGTPFHSSRHLVVDRIHTVDPGKVGTIAHVIKFGWAGPNGVLRHPEVAVYELVNQQQG